jgi:hypothetical protein
MLGSKTVRPPGTTEATVEDQRHTIRAQPLQNAQELFHAERSRRGSTDPRRGGASHLLRCGCAIACFCDLTAWVTSAGTQFPYESILPRRTRRRHYGVPTLIRITPRTNSTMQNTPTAIAQLMARSAGGDGLPFISRDRSRYAAAAPERCARWHRRCCRTGRERSLSRRTHRCHPAPRACARAN